MRCTKARRMIYLFREGELSERERRRLEQHLQGCAACALEHRQIPALGDRISYLRSLSPVIDRPEELTDSIMRAVETRRRRPPVRAGAWRLFPRWQPVVVGAAALLACVFFWQTYADGVRLSLLEGRLAQQDSVYAAGERGMMQSFVGIISGLNGDQGFSRQEASVVSGALMQALAAQAGAEPATVDRLLRTRYPHLASLKAGATMSPGERAIIVAEAKAFFADLEQILENGGQSHAR